MSALVSNNAQAVLASGISSTATTIAVQTGQGAMFPSPVAPDFFYATLVNQANTIEIVKCTARTGDTLSIVRAQDNTLANAYNAGDRLELRPTAALFNNKLDKDTGGTVGTNTQTGALGINGPAGSYRMESAYTAGVLRWRWGITGDAETGSNAGTLWQVQRYSDTGAYIDSPLTINRATGAVSLPNILTVGSNGVFTAPQATLIVIGTTVGQTLQMYSDTAGEAVIETFQTGTPSTKGTLNLAKYGGGVKVSGSGGLTVVNGITVGGTVLSNSGNIILNTAAGTYRSVNYQTSGVSRWTVGVNTAAESGSNSGSDFFFNRIADNGTFIDTPIQIVRSTGQTQIQGAGGLQVTNGVKLTNGSVTFADGTTQNTAYAPQVAYFTQQAAAGTNSSDNLANGAWTQRPLTTTVVNTIIGCSLSGGAVTLPAGTYRVEARGAAHSANAFNTRLRIRNVTDSTSAVVGTVVGNGNGGGQWSATLTGVFTIGATKTIQIEQYVASSAADGGAAQNSAGEVEVYATLSLQKM